MATIIRKIYIPGSHYISIFSYVFIKEQRCTHLCTFYKRTQMHRCTVREPSPHRSEVGLYAQFCYLLFH